MKKTIIIGSGFGGISLAIRLQAAGIPILLLEQRDKPGGCAYVYHKLGFTFDAGPTVITHPESIKELFIISGKQMEDYIELLPVKPFYRLCWENGRYFNYDNSQKNLEDQIKLFNHNDVYGYRKFLNYSRKAFKDGYLKFGTIPFLSFSDMISAIPKLIRLQAWRSIYNKVSSYIKNDYLRQVFSFHSLLIGGNPFTTSSIYTLIHALEREWGVWFPKGGTSALINAMIKLFKDIGGEIQLNSKVCHLEVNNKTITAAYLQDKTVIPVCAVASNADIIHTYGKLLQNYPYANSKLNSLKTKRMSISLFVLYFGLNYHHDQLAHHTICFSQNYRRLINDIFYKKYLSDDFSLYLHAPCITDQSLAPNGFGSYYVLAPVPNLATANINWSVKSLEFSRNILNYLESNYMPGLKKQLVTYHVFTPFNFRDELNSYAGSAFSLEPLLSQSAWFRPHNRDKYLRNLYLVGAGTHPGAGIPGVINSAKITANLMLEDLI